MREAAYIGSGCCGVRGRWRDGRRGHWEGSAGRESQSGETVWGSRSRRSEEPWAAAGGRDVVEEVGEELDHAGMGAERGAGGPAVRVAGARAGYGGCELYYDELRPVPSSSCGVCCRWITNQRPAK